MAWAHVAHAGRQPHTSKLVVWLTEQGREEKGQKQETTAKTIGRWTQRDADVSSAEQGPSGRRELCASPAPGLEGGRGGVGRPREGKGQELKS